MAPCVSSLPMTLQAESHRWLKRQVLIEVGAMQLVAAQTRDRSVIARIDYIRANRVGTGVNLAVAAKAEVRIEGTYQVTSAVVSDLNHTSLVPRWTSSASNTSLPTRFELDQNYPNPFNPTTKISFALPVAGHVSIGIFNVLGQRVTSLIDEHLEAGRHSISWDSRDSHGGIVSSGVYFYRIAAEGFVETKKMMLLK